MALIKCKECGNMVSDRAEACPKCGCPIGSATHSQLQLEYAADNNHTNNRGNSNKNGVLWFFLIFAIVAIIIFLLSGKGCSNGSTNDMWSASCDSTVVDTTETVEAVDSEAYEEPTTIKPEVYINLTKDGEYHLTGTVAGKACTMDLKILGNEVNGTYYYNKYRKPLDLQGTIHDNEMQLDEIDNYGETTGELNGHVSGNTFNGTHTHFPTMRDTKFSFKAK